MESNSSSQSDVKTYDPNRVYVDGICTVDYSDRSGAHRGAKRAGLTKGDYEIVSVVGGRFTYRLIEKPAKITDPIGTQNTLARLPGETYAEYRNRRRMNDYIAKIRARGRILVAGKGTYDKKTGKIMPNNRAARREKAA